MAHKGMVLILVGLMMFQALAFGEELVQTTAINEGLEFPDDPLDLLGYTEFLLSVGLLTVGLVDAFLQLLTLTVVPGIPRWLRAGMLLFIWLTVGEAFMGLVSQFVGSLGSILEALNPF